MDVEVRRQKGLFLERLTVGRNPLVAIAPIVPGRAPGSNAYARRLGCDPAGCCDIHRGSLQDTMARLARVPGGGRW